MVILVLLTTLLLISLPGVNNFAAISKPPRANNFAAILEPLEGIYPIQFTEVTSEAYVFTNIVSETYSEPFLYGSREIDLLIDEAFSIPVHCDSADWVRDDQACLNFVAEMNDLKTRAKNLARQEINSTLAAVKRSMRLNGTIARHRRDVGSVFYDTSPLARSRHVDGCNDHGNLWHNLDEARAQIDRIVPLLKLQYEVLLNFSMTARNQLRESNALMLNIADSISMRSLLRNELTYMMFHVEKLREACSRRVVPRNLVDPAKLQNDTEALQKKLGPLGMEIAIPPSNLEDFYKLHLCSCEFVNDTIQLTIHYPVKPADAEYELFLPIYLPFKFQNQICSVQTTDAVLIRNKITNQVRVSSGPYLADCDLSTHMCRLYPNHNADIGSICLGEMFSQKPIGELQKLCSFVCTTLPESVPMINQIRPEEYVLTNIPDSMYIENSTGEYCLVTGPNKDGAFRLSLPCDSRLSYRTSGTNVTLIDKIIPCHRDPRTSIASVNHKLQPIVPLQWLNNGTLSQGPSLNTLWKNMTPNYSFMTMAEFGELVNAATGKKEKFTLSNGVSNFLYQTMKSNLSHLLMFGFAFALSLLYQRFRVLAQKIFRLENISMMRNLPYL